MRENKLLELLRTFSLKDLKSLGKYLESPFLKRPRNVVNFFNHLKRYHPQYDSPDLDKEKLFKKLFPGEKYNERILANQIFDLTKSAEEFLSYNALLNNESEFLLSLSKAYLDNKLLKHSERVNKAMEKILVPGFSMKKDYISKFRRLTQLKNAYFTEFNDFENLIESKSQYFKASAIQFVMDYIDIFGSREPAKTTYGKDFNNPFIKAVSESFDISKFLEIMKQEDSENPYLVISYYLLKILKEPEAVEHYHNFKKFFYDYLSKEDCLLDREEKYSIFNFLINYCTQKFNMNFMKESLEVYKKILEHDAYSESESENMQLIIYRNIMKVCISLNETEWFGHFIEEYSDKLSPEYRRDMKNLSYAHLHFLQKDFDKSLESINKISENFFLNKTDIRNLKLKLFYELNYTESAFSLIASYRQFLMQSKNISEKNKKVFKNFIHYCHLLLEMKTGSPLDDISFIKSGIEKENDIINKQWLLDKANELEGN